MDCTLHLPFVHRTRFETPENSTNFNPHGVDIVPGSDRTLLRLLRLGGIAQGTDLRQDGIRTVLRPMVRSPFSSQPAPDEPDGGDGSLVRAARGGDRRACRAIWEKYAPLVQRLVRRFFGPGPDHPDVCQEAFMRVFKRLDELREPAALPGFIIGVTLGVARNEARRRRIRAIVGLNSTMNGRAPFCPAPRMRRVRRSVRFTDCWTAWAQRIDRCSSPDMSRRWK